MLTDQSNLIGELQVSERLTEVHGVSEEDTRGYILSFTHNFTLTHTHTHSKKIQCAQMHAHESIHVPEAAVS